MKSKAIILSAPGGPEVLQLSSIEVPAPGPGQILLRHEAIGINFHDVNLRRGINRGLNLPGVPGIEAVGIVLATGHGVQGIAIGDRVGYVDVGYGAYSEARLLDAARAVIVPEGQSAERVAASLVKGLTAELLLFRAARSKPGDTVLIHAAAGGVGLHLGQWAAHLGMTVIGTVSSAKKAETAAAAGYTHLIDYTRENFRARVMELTDGRGVDAVFESIGGEIFSHSLDCLALFGHLASYGHSSGPVKALDVTRLRSRALSRQVLFDYIADRALLVEMSNRLFQAMQTDVIAPIPVTRYPLAEAARAHADLEGRHTIGSLLLIP